MSEDKIKVWRNNANCTEPIPTTLLQAQLLDASNIVEELEATTTSLRGLLRRCANVIVTVENIYPSGFEFKETQGLLDEIVMELKDG